MIKQDISEKQANFVYLSIGSNLGDRLTNIESTKKLLILNKIFIQDSSSYYETLSWPDAKNPKFLNIVLKFF